MRQIKTNYLPSDKAMLEKSFCFFSQCWHKNNRMRQYFLKGHSLLSLNGLTPNNSQFSNKNIQISQEINSTMQVFYHGGFISKVTSKDFIHGFKT